MTETYNGFSPSDEYIDSDNSLYTDLENIDKMRNKQSVGNDVLTSQLLTTDNTQMHKYWKQLVFYAMCNSFRFLLIGIIVLKVNSAHHHDVMQFKYGNDSTACCLCHNYAQSINPNHRVDWSMCYDVCNQCASCQSIEESNQNCQIAPFMSIDNTDNACPKQLSVASFGLIKKYTFYGFAALASVALYIIFMIILLFVNKAHSITSSAVIFIFLNIVTSLVCAYCIIKPYQYHLLTFYVEDISFECYTDSINQNIESIFAVLGTCASLFVALPFALWCCRCITFSRDTSSYKRRKVYGFARRIVLLLAVMGCLIAIVVLTWISLVVSKRYPHSDGNIWHKPSVLVTSIDLLMVLSLFDMCIFCPFCRHKMSTIYSAMGFARRAYENTESSYHRASYNL
eukprot:278170_1